MTQRDGGPRTKSPREFVKEMPDGGSGKSAAADAVPDAKGAAGFVGYVTQLGLGALMRARGARRDRT